MFVNVLSQAFMFALVGMLITLVLIVAKSYLLSDDINEVFDNFWLIQFFVIANVFILRLLLANPTFAKYALGN